MTVSFLNWGVHVWRPSHILRPTPTPVEPLRVSSPEAVAYQFEIRHVATMIYMTSALVLEERSPYGPGTDNNGPGELRSKEEIIRFLRESLTYARRAMASLTEDNHLNPVPSAFGKMPRSAVAAGVAYHSFNHYGQMVVYARMNGIVPPASVPSGDGDVR